MVADSEGEGEGRKAFEDTPAHSVGEEHLACGFGDAKNTVLADSDSSDLLIRNTWMLLRNPEIELDTEKASSTICASAENTCGLFPRPHMRIEGFTVTLVRSSSQLAGEQRRTRNTERFRKVVEASAHSERFTEISRAKIPLFSISSTIYRWI